MKKLAWVYIDLVKRKLLKKKKLIVIDNRVPNKDVNSLRCKQFILHKTM